jgi:hypothetical protein
VTKQSSQDLFAGVAKRFRVMRYLFGGYSNTRIALFSQCNS